MYKKDIQKIRQIIQGIEPKCDYYGNAWLNPESTEDAVKEIIVYLDKRGYAITKLSDKPSDRKEAR